MVNAYLVEDVLVDAGTPSARKRITRQLDGRTIAAHVVTHAHPDHFGSSHAVCERYDVPLWTGAKDVEAITTATPVPAPEPLEELALTGIPPQPLKESGAQRACRAEADR